MRAIILLSLGLAFAIPATALDIQREIILPAQSYAGTRYCSGGIAPPCFDCSGFVLRIYQPHVALPRVSRDMAQSGQPVNRSELRPGDLVFFATAGRAGAISHVAIYMGQDSIIHAISDGPNRGVTTTPLSANYWSTRFVSARRVLPQPSPAARQDQVTDVPIQFARGTYRGDLLDGQPHGEGTMEMNNGDRYDGQFENGVFHGEGRYRWANQDQFEGMFRNGEMHGEGTFRTAAGTTTTGRWDNGQLVTAPAETAPAETQQASRRTYIRSQDSPWETWDGIVEGDFRAWQQQDQADFEAFRRRSEPQRR